MVSRIGIRRDSKKLNIVKSYKEEDVVENHDHPHLERTQHIENENEPSNNKPTIRWVLKEFTLGKKKINKNGLYMRVAVFILKNFKLTGYIIIKFE